MQLNEEGMLRFQQHLQGVLRNPCAVCGSGNWQFDDTVFELRQFVGGGVAANGTIKPVVSITCNGCGNIIFMNALTTGVVRVVANQQQMSAGGTPSDGSEPKQENLSQDDEIEPAKD